MFWAVLSSALGTYTLNEVPFLTVTPSHNNLSISRFFKDFGEKTKAAFTAPVKMGGLDSISHCMHPSQTFPIARVRFLFDALCGLMPPIYPTTLMTHG